MANRKAKLEKDIKSQNKQASFEASLKRSRIRYKKRIEAIKTLAFSDVNHSISRSISFKNPELKFLYDDLHIRDQSFLTTYWKSNEKEKDKFWDFVADVDKKTNLLEQEDLKSYWDMFFYRLFWAQDWKHWNPKTNNEEKLYLSLVNHLFSKYPLPKFLLKLWRQPRIEERHLDLFFHLASGKNIKTAENLPIPVTAKMAHHFLSAPDSYSINDAFIFSQLKSLNADKKLIEEVCSNFREVDFLANDFWVTVYRFFINNPFLDRIHFQPMRDYIYNQKFTTGAPNPGFSLVNRNPETLLNQVEAWHSELARANARAQAAARFKYKPVDYKWDPTFPSFKFTEGTEKNKTMWSVAELTSSQELRDEGSSLRHCVGSYGLSCFEKRSAILSLMNNGKKSATLEINLSSKRLIQARGLANRALTAKEARAVEEWMRSSPFFK